MKKFEQIVGAITRLWFFGKLLQRLWEDGYAVGVVVAKDGNLHLVERVEKS